MSMFRYAHDFLPSCAQSIRNKETNTPRCKSDVLGKERKGKKESVDVATHKSTMSNAAYTSRPETRAREAQTWADASVALSSERAELRLNLPALLLLGLCKSLALLSMTLWFCANSPSVA